MAGGPGTTAGRARGLGLLPWVALLVASLPLLVYGFPRGHDWSYELTRVAEFDHALRGGQVPPFWAENLYGGYGSPVFVFYAPLFAAVAVALAAVVGSYQAGATAALCVFGAVGVVALGSLMRRLLAVTGLCGPAVPAAARTAVCLYLLSPYLIGDALLRNACAEYAALCLLPLPLDGLLRLPAAPRRGAAQLGLGLALVILAHNLTALVAVVLVLAGALALGARKARLRDGITLAASVALGLVIASFFWVPALALRGHVRLDELLRGKFDFHHQFQPLGEFFGWQEFYALGLLPLALLVTSFLVLKPAGWRSREQRIAVALFAGAAVFLFLQTRASTALWENLPFLPLFQFPWRFMGPLALVVAMASGLAFARLLGRASPAVRRAGELGLLLLAIANALPHLSAARPLEEALGTPFEASLEAAAIRRGNHRVTVLDEYLPPGAHPLLWQQLPAAGGPVVGFRGQVRIAVTRDEPRRIELVADAAEAASLRLARWHFPGWQLRRNGEPAPLRSNPYGSIDVDVPAGESHLELRLLAPLWRRICLGPSVAGLVLAAALLVPGRGSTRRRFLRRFA